MTAATPFSFPPPSAPARWELYRVLSEPVRLRLLALAAEEELAIGELAELLGESQPNVSRHASPLKAAGLVVVRKQGTRALVRLADDALADPVVADALASGRALCDADGSLRRVADVLRQRDAVAREFFARGDAPADVEADRIAPELGAYLAAFAALLPRRALAIDVGTGDGGSLDVLAPAFDRVVAIDRAEAQIARARARVAARGWTNVSFVCGELDGEGVRSAVSRFGGAPAHGGGGADVVFAARVLHHAPSPAHVMRSLAALVRGDDPAGAVVVLDYARHDDESMRDHADLWLGFDGDELVRLAQGAGLDDARVLPIAAPLLGAASRGGPDRHLPWQVLVARGRATAKDHERKKDHHG